MLEVRAFLAFRQWPSLAEGPVRAVATKYCYLILNHVARTHSLI